MKTPEISEEYVEEVREKLKKICGERTTKTLAFAQAYDRSLGVDYVNRRMFVIPSEIINVEFGGKEYYGNPASMEALRRIGCSRATRVIRGSNPNGKKKMYRCVWSIPYGVIGL